MLHCLLILHLALLKSVSACNTELQANCRNISNDRSETFKTKLCWERNKTMCVKSTERFVSNSLRSILSFFILYIVNDTILKTKSRRRNENMFHQLRTLIFVLQVRNFATKFRFDSSPYLRNFADVRTIDAPKSRRFFVWKKSSHSVRRNLPNFGKFRLHLFCTVL